MDPREEISQDVLASTDLVLCEYAPWLRSQIVQITAAGPSKLADSPAGKTLYDRFHVNIPLAAVEDIVACLLQVEQAQGEQARFRLHSINRLVLIWRFQADRLRRAKKPLQRV